MKASSRRGAEVQSRVRVFSIIVQETLYIAWNRPFDLTSIAHIAINRALEHLKISYIAMNRPLELSNISHIAIDRALDSSEMSYIATNRSLELSNISHMYNLSFKFERGQTGN